MTDQAPIAATIRHDGWTPQRQTQFLDHLAGDGSVRAASGHVGMSREAAYRLRRRDPLFARAWDAALMLAREASAQVLANRAIDGIEEEIWYRGEMVGTRRKYDSRLLLAHMARLDKIAEDRGAAIDAGRFDELLAVVGGEPLPPGIECDEDGMPPRRDDHIAMAAEDAKIAFVEAWLAEHPEVGEDDKDGGELDLAERIDLQVERDRAYRAALAEDRWNARIVAGLKWDAWRERAHAAADRLLATPPSTDAETPSPCTLSELSTSSGEAPAGTAFEAGTGSAAAPTWADYHAGRGPRPQA